MGMLLSYREGYWLADNAAPVATPEPEPEQAKAARPKRKRTRNTRVAGSEAAPTADQPTEGGSTDE